MNKILFIANEFPPMGGSGVQRTSKFVKYLTRLGEEIIVVTKDGGYNLKDETLMKDVPENLEIHRLKSYSIIDKTGIKKIPYKVLSKVISPDYEYYWYKNNFAQVCKIVESNNIDIIYSTSFPYSSHLMARDLKKIYPHLKWIADFRDEWTNNPYHLDSKIRKLKLKSEKQMELSVTKSCDFLIANTPIMLQNFIKDNPDLKDHSTFIPNGFDEEDFAGKEKPVEKNEKFTISYTGSLYGRRNLDEFFTGLKHSIDNSKIKKEDITINIVGNIHKKAVEEYAQKYDLDGVINNLGYVSHDKNIDILLKSDLLILVIGKGKGSENFYTGKIFEYIRSYTDILAIVPPHGVAADVINETKTGMVSDMDDIENISSIIEKYYNDYKNDEVNSRDKKAIDKYSRQRQAQMLLDIINHLRADN